MKRTIIALVTSLFFSIFSPLFVVSPYLAADETQNESLPIGLTEEEKLRLDEIGIDHRITAAPSGVVRNPGEWEPSEGVIIRWPLGIPIELVAEMSEDVMVTTIVPDAVEEQNAIDLYSARGVNMDNTGFIHARTNSMWTRDYGPWFIFDDDALAIVDHVYNRPRPLDDVIPQVIGAEWGLDVHGMDLIHTGGNHMSDGLGMSMSTRLVYVENPSKTEPEIHQIIYDYLGNDYTTLEYIRSGGIHHIDCWAKFLSPAVVLVKDVPPSDSTYDELNARADFLSTQISAWGVPYTVVRIFCPAGTFYTNSLILNDKVFIPLFGEPEDSAALQVYQDSMPGYEVLGYTGSWANEDALHCRTMGVPDRGMLFIDHIPFRTEDIIPGDYLITSTIIACSGASLLPDELKIHYSVDGGPWTDAPLGASVEPDSYEGYIPEQIEDSVISYFLEAADDSGRVETHPYIGRPWPHQFIAICPNHPLVDVTPDGPLPVCTGDDLLLTANPTGGGGPFAYQWTEDGFDIPGATSATYPANNTGTHLYNCKVWGDGCLHFRSDADDTELTWRSEPFFSGLTSVTNPQNSTCALELAWDPGTPLCDGPVHYNVYRSDAPGFTPDAASLLIAGLSGTTYADMTGLEHGTTYYYIVRAEDISNGAEDGNMIELSGMPTGSGVGHLTLYSDDFEDPAGWANWTVITGPGPHTCGEWARADSSGQRPPDGAGYYALADSESCGSGSQTSTDLVSGIFDCDITGVLSVTLEYDIYYRYLDGDDTTVEVFDGADWQVIWTAPSSDVQGHHTWDVTAYAAGNPDFRFRFNYQNASWDYWIAVDNVVLTADVDDWCVPGRGVVTVPDGTESGTTPLRVAKSGADLNVSWDVSRCASTGYHLIWGWGVDIGDYLLSGSDCTLDESGNHLWTTAPDTASDWCWFIVVGNDGSVTEGGWGTDSFSNQRTTGPSTHCGTEAIDLTPCI